MNQTNVAVIFGGVSSEHEISLRSATSVLQELDRTRYHIIMVGITRDGRWLHYQGEIDGLMDGSWEHHPANRPAFLAPDTSVHGLLCLDNGQPVVIPVDVVFPVLHGQNGEDGTIQGLLEMAQIPYVGSGVLSSATSMDKAVAHTILEHAGVPMARWILVNRGVDSLSQVDARIREQLGYPVFVKPANAGSSVGVSKVCGPDELERALQEAFQVDRKVLVEEAIVGQEVECAVLGNEEPAASTVGEIAPKQAFYSYSAKYTDDSTDLYIPARIPAQSLEQVRALAAKVFCTMGCHGLARIDFFVRGDGSVVLNELNTMPGFTSISMYPQLWQYEGMAYSQLLTRLIQLAQERVQP